MHRTHSGMLTNGGDTSLPVTEQKSTPACEYQEEGRKWFRLSYFKIIVLIIFTKYWKKKGIIRTLQCITICHAKPH